MTISSDVSSVDEVAQEIEDIADIARGQPLSVRLDASSGASDIRVGPGVISRIGEWVRESWPKARRSWIVTDEHVGSLHAEATEDYCGRQDSRYQHTPLLQAKEARVSLPPASSTTGSLRAAWSGVTSSSRWEEGSWGSRRVRGGDSITRRGSGSGADESTGRGRQQRRGQDRDQPRGWKNLIGAFLQPPIVIADTALLRTMPDRERRSGWAEVVKHAVIQRSTPGGERGDLAQVLARNAPRLFQLEEPVTSYVVWRNIALKAAVVAADERETGIRAFSTSAIPSGMPLKPWIFNSCTAKRSRSACGPRASSVCCVARAGALKPRRWAPHRSVRSPVLRTAGRSGLLLG